jgi:hypothetical protein
MSTPRLRSVVALSALLVVATGCMTRDANVPQKICGNSRTFNLLRTGGANGCINLDGIDWGSGNGSGDGGSDDTSWGTGSGTSGGGVSGGTETGTSGGNGAGGLFLPGGPLAGIDPTAIFASLLARYGSLRAVPISIFDALRQHFSWMRGQSYGAREIALVTSAGGADNEGDPEPQWGAGPHVKLYLLEQQRGSANPRVATEFFAYSSNFRGGVRSAVGDVDGDGLIDIVTAPGPGGGPHVKIFAANGQERYGFMAYDPNFRGGVFVAIGDVDNDQKGEIIVGAGYGGGPHVKVFKIERRGGTYSHREIGSWFAYDAGFRGGVRVASGDVDDDGYADIITGAGPGAGPHVKVFSGATLRYREPAVLRSFFAYAEAFRGGVYVGASDVNGDAHADIVTGAGPGAGPHLKVFSGANGATLVSRFAYDPNFRGGVRVSGGLGTDEELYLDVLSAAGPGGGPHVRAWHGTSEHVFLNFMAFDRGFTGGVFANFAAYW